MDQPGTIWPSELKLAKGGALLNLTFESGESFALPSEYLRVMSPSAEVQGHSRRERKTIGGKNQVKIVAIEPVGTYAVRLSFDDLHSTGIYTWTYLHELGLEQDARWAAYLADLEKGGLSRDRSGEAHLHGSE